MSLPNPYSNAELRRMSIRKCCEPGCDKDVDGKNKRCIAHRQERPFLLRRFRRFNIDKFKKSQRVKDIEARQEER